MYYAIHSTMNGIISMWTAIINDKGQERAAKDFLWEHLEQHNRDLLLSMVKHNSEQEKESLECIVFREPVIIGFRYKRQHSHEENNHT